MAGPSADPLRAKATLIGRATITIPSGQSKQLKIRLKRKARAKLKRGRLNAKLSLVAVAADGTEETTTQALKIAAANTRGG